MRAPATVAQVNTGGRFLFTARSEISEGGSSILLSYLKVGRELIQMTYEVSAGVLGLYASRA